MRDHGLGIPRAQREHIFERFYQAHSSRHRVGLGLGLFISRQIVEMHGGQIRVEFPRGRGTRFIVRLPMAPARRRGRRANLHSSPTEIDSVERLSSESSSAASSWGGWCSPPRTSR